MTLIAPTQIVENASSITLPTPQKDGFAFDCWNLEEKTYVGGDTVEITEDTTFTASWTEKEPDTGNDEEEDKNDGESNTPSYPDIPVIPDDDKDEEEIPDGPVFDEIPDNGFAVDNNGDTYFFKDGEMVTGWVEIDNTWYYMNTDSGKMVSDDWQQVNNTWYLFGENGEMATGWQLVNGKWYYLYSWGGMAYNTTIGGYVLGSDGAWIR